MKVKLNKDALFNIEIAFEIILNDMSKKDDAMRSIEANLNNSFPEMDFSCSIIEPNKQSPLFVMSVFPEVSVLDKIINAVINNTKADKIDTKKIETIQNLWETNKKWIIEIDSRLFDSRIIKLNKKELTAILLHEIGHIVYSNSIAARVSLILNYELSKATTPIKGMLKDRIFRYIMALPVLDNCIADSKKTKSSIKDEIRADKFVKKMGYSRDLASVLTKLMDNYKYQSNLTLDDKMSKGSQFSISTLDDFKKRQDKLVKKNLLSVKENSDSVYMKEFVDEILSALYEDGDLREGEKLHFMQETADRCAEEYIQEFVLFKKKLERFDPNDLDYIGVKISQMKTETDKLLILSYINNKLDIVEYYIEILNNPEVAKKYSIPNSLNQLEAIRKRLLIYRKEALNFKLPDPNINMMIIWGQGNEG